MSETIMTIMQWHEETFPDATLDGQRQKYREELSEYVASGEKDIYELADMFIVACGIARFSLKDGTDAFSDVYDWYMAYDSFNDNALWDAINEKMAINRKRKWTKKNGNYKHVEE